MFSKQKYRGYINMTKFHINKHGVPAPCKAKDGNCPLGGDETHFTSEKEAQSYIDKKNEEDYKLMPEVLPDGNKKKLPDNSFLISGLDNSFSSKEEAQEYADKINQEMFKDDKKKLTPAQKRAKAKREQKERLARKLQDFWQDEKMVEHELKNNKYIELNGSFVEIADAKPKIESTIWFDDEQEVPENNFETFYNYNVRLNMPKYVDMRGRNIEGTGSLKIASKYAGQDTLDLARLTYENEPKGEFREVSQSELDEINKGIEEVRANYDKRLRSYYKRYSDKVRVKGYWANR